jgi:hypothetical protein
MPTPPTIKRLFAVSGNECAFPRCKQPLIENNTVVGEMCHIKGEKPKAARYDPNQTDRERDSFENLILLCGTHHTIIDGDEKKYTVERLTAMKAKHKSKQTTTFAITDNLAIRIALLGTGATLATVLGEIGYNLRSFRDLFAADAEPSSNPLKPAEIPAILKQVGPGTIVFVAKGNLARAVGGQLVTLFEREGWRTGEIHVTDRSINRSIDLSKVPENRLLFIIDHPDDHAFRVAVGPVLSTGLSAMGFVPVEGGKMHQRGKSEVLRLLFARYENQDGQKL